MLNFNFFFSHKCIRNSVCIQRCLKTVFQARLSQEHEQFLVNPFGMVYSEITASTLVKVDVRGEIVDTGSTGLGISKASFTLHSAIHQARPDIRCIIHLHTPAAVAVSGLWIDSVFINWCFLGWKKIKVGGWGRKRKNASV